MLAIIKKFIIHHLADICYSEASGQYPTTLTILNNAVILHVKYFPANHSDHHISLITGVTATYIFKEHTDIYGVQ